ncbi:hypothetical protein [Desulfosporosinus sp.]|nr:hypothetical protein [Desulfosporosinus sp.]MCO5384522.1 hypothetical protein [Desulfosporosinus sp.]MDA8220298.1 hypothetical protein [Desulfitobacterium hafniense]
MGAALDAVPTEMSLEMVVSIEVSVGISSCSEVEEGVSDIHAGHVG